MYTAVNDRAWYYGRRTGRALGTIVHNRYRWGAFNWADAAAVGTSPFAVRLRSAATSFPGRSACGPLRSPVVFSRIEALRIPFMTMRVFALFERRTHIFCFGRRLEWQGWRTDALRPTSGCARYRLDLQTCLQLVLFHLSDRSPRERSNKVGGADTIGGSTCHRQPGTASDYAPH